MFLEYLKNNSKILSDVIIMQFGKGVLIAYLLFKFNAYSKLSLL